MLGFDRSTYPSRKPRDPDRVKCGFCIDPRGNRRKRCWVCNGAIECHYAGSIHLSWLRNINERLFGIEPGGGMPWIHEYSFNEVYVMPDETYEAAQAYVQPSVDALMDALGDWIPTAPTLDADEHAAMGSAIEVAGTIVKDALRNIATSNPIDVIIYRQQPLVTEATARRMFEAMLQDGGQHASQLRSQHFKPTRGGMKPPMTMLAIQATGYGGIWDWASASPGRDPDRLAPECPHLTFLPLQDPAPHPAQGCWGSLSFNSIYGAKAVITAKGYAEATAAEAVQELVQNVPTHVQANPRR